jgi:methyl-accepting chemotaxis protein
MKINLLVRQLAGFLLVALILVGLGFFAIIQIEKIHQNVVTIEEKIAPGTHLVDEVRYIISHYRRQQFIHSIYSETKDKEDTAVKMENDDRQIEQLFTDYQALEIGGEGDALFEEVKATWEAYKQSSAPFLAISNQKDQEGALGVLLGPADKPFDGVLDSTQAWLDYMTGLTTLEKQSAETTYQNAERMIEIWMVVMLGVSLALGWFISNSISRGVKKMSGVLEEISRGGLVEQLPVRGSDELTDMARSFNHMVVYLRSMASAAEAIADGDLTASVKPASPQDVLGNAFTRMTANLRTTVKEVNERSSSLKAASAQLANASAQAGQATNQIAATIQQVAAGTAQESASVNNTAASIDAISRSIREVAEGAREQANAVTQSSAVTAQLNDSLKELVRLTQISVQGGSDVVQASEEGRRTVENTIQAINNIRAKVNTSAEKVQEMGQRSDQIGSIVQTIEDIAGQTNLLALNAAIEAARAGEQGKGFAVVADEVRKLAERSSQATKEISGLILGIQGVVQEAVVAMQASILEVDQGVEKAGTSGSALAGIRDTADEVARGATSAINVANHALHSADMLVSTIDRVSNVVERNTSATQRLKDASHVVQSTVETVSSVSEENSATVEEISASAEEMSAQVQEVSASAVSLDELAEALQESVSRFRV